MLSLVATLKTESPFWYVTPEEQIKKVCSQFGISKKAIPPVPNFVPETPTEILMLCVYLEGEYGVRDTFKKLWSVIEPPFGFEKTHWSGFNVGRNHMRLADGVPRRYGVQWVGFDPCANLNKTVYDLWENENIAKNLAHCEVLMAMFLFPDWIVSWDGSAESPLPNIAGLCMKGTDHGSWDRFPYAHLNRCGQLRLQAGHEYYNPDNIRGMKVSSPTVRQL